MPRVTSNKSIRLDEPKKATRRRAIAEGETDEQNRAAGASGKTRTGPARPGRAAALRSIAQVTRSNRWRSPSKGPRTMRRGNLAKGSHTGRARG